MSDDEPFLRRWSRLKTDAAPAPEPEPEEAEPVEEEEEAPDLPPLESLGRDSDYTGFLHKAVPAATRVAALRMAWRSDPGIAGFKGLADYDWDCNAEGYGKLLPTDDIRRLCDRILGPAPEEEADEAEESDETPPSA